MDRDYTAILERQHFLITGQLGPRERMLHLERAIDDYCEAWYRVPLSAPYTRVPDGIGERISRMAGDFQVELPDLHKLAMIRFMRRYHQGRAEALRLSDEIQALTRRQFLRIARGFQENGSGFYDFRNDLFLKDLGIVSGRLWPCHARLLKYGPGVPRSLLFRAGIRDFFRAAGFFLFQGRGFGPVLELHVHLSMLDAFDPAGWEACLRAAAGMLERYPEVKFLMGSAWFYDPVVERISPRLAYNRRLPMAGGAQVFRGGEDEGATRSALAKSPTRRRLHAEGKYRPASYFLLWDRDRMIRWAKEREA